MMVHSPFLLLPDDSLSVVVVASATAAALVVVADSPLSFFSLGSSKNAIRTVAYSEYLDTANRHQVRLL